VFPSKSTRLQNGMTIALTTIRDIEQEEHQPVSFPTVYNYDSTLAKGKQVVVQAGVEGVIQRSWEVRQVNGQEASRKLISETKVPPTTQIVSVGTYVAPPPEPAAAPDGSQCVKTMTVWSTYYTAASAGGNTTRTGTGVYKGIVAVDPRVIPLGTRMYIPGYGYGLAADTGGGVKGAWIDVAYGSDDVYDWYSHYVDICILG
jgi:3D (Asp-Asp-Asp) domain-containing protein